MNLNKKSFCQSRFYINSCRRICFFRHTNLNIEKERNANNWGENIVPVVKLGFFFRSTSTCGKDLLFIVVYKFCFFFFFFNHNSVLLIERTLLMCMRSNRRRKGMLTIYFTLRKRTKCTTKLCIYATYTDRTRLLFAGEIYLIIWEKKTKTEATSRVTRFRLSIFLEWWIWHQASMIRRHEYDSN